MKTKDIKKTAKRVKKPLYVIDITECESVEDIIYTTILTKINNDVEITDEELTTVASILLDNIIDRMFNGASILYMHNDGLIERIYNDRVTVVKKTKKKPSVFKRFWNWITRK